MTWNWEAWTTELHHSGTLEAADYWGAMTAAMSHPDIPNGTVEFYVWRADR